MYDAIIRLVPGETAKWNNRKDPYIRKACTVKPRHTHYYCQRKRGTTVPNHYIKSSDIFFSLTRTPFKFVAMDKHNGPFTLPCVGYK
jgi:hypothetical protein